MQRQGSLISQLSCCIDCPFADASPTVFPFFLAFCQHYFIYYNHVIQNHPHLDLSPYEMGSLPKPLAALRVDMSMASVLQLCGYAAFDCAVAHFVM